MTFIKKCSANPALFIKINAIILVTLGLTACVSYEKTHSTVFNTSVTGNWITESDGSMMLDPQPSGLKYSNGYLFSISDGSANSSQIKKLHKISIEDFNVIHKYGPLKLAANIMQSCFVSYLTTRPDFEGLAVIPNEPNTWLLVTEDTTRSGSISPECQSQFAKTGSTTYPSLLVRIELVNNELMLTGVRALQFEDAHSVGNFPNDGIEGLAFTRDGRILLGLEKDMERQARVFELKYTKDMFNAIDTFLALTDSQLQVPKFIQGNHPINGMDVYYPNAESAGYLIAAARNDNQLWIMDLAKRRSTTIVNIEFSAPSDMSGGCAPTHKIKNTAIEGVAVHEDTVYLINDPWKKVYKDNALCAEDLFKYEQMAPLLFRLPINPAWVDD